MEGFGWNDAGAAGENYCWIDAGVAGEFSHDLKYIYINIMFFSS